MDFQYGILDNFFIRLQSMQAKIFDSNKDKYKNELRPKNNEKKHTHTHKKKREKNNASKSMVVKNLKQSLSMTFQQTIFYVSQEPSYSTFSSCFFLAQCVQSLVDKWSLFNSYCCRWKLFSLIYTLHTTFNLVYITVFVFYNIEYVHILFSTPFVWSTLWIF